MTLIGEREINKEYTALAVGEVFLTKETYHQDSLDRPYLVRQVRVGDYSDRNLEKKRAYKEAGDAGEAWLGAHPEARKTIVRRKTREVVIDPANVAAQNLYYRKDGSPSTMVEWAKDFPDAIALYALQHPDTDGGRMLESGVLDEHTRENFIYMLDAIGIRTRAAIYSQLLVDLAGAIDDQKMKIMSVGSGAAVPNINANRRVEEELHKYIEWSFFDNDPRALQFAHTLINEAIFKRSTVDYGPVRFDSEKGQQFEGRSYEQAYQEPDASYDVVDALGLWEYLRDETAVTFAKNMYAKVKSGGSMIISNMLNDRPQLEFNKRGVGWPHLFLRSNDDLLTIFATAGIDTNNVTMSRAEDGIYVVAEIRKP